MDVYIQFFAKHLLKMDSLKLCRQLTPILTQNRKYIIYNLVVFFFGNQVQKRLVLFSPALHFIPLHFMFVPIRFMWHGREYDLGLTSIAPLWLNLIGTSTNPDLSTCFTFIVCLLLSWVFNRSVKCKAGLSEPISTNAAFQIRFNLLNSRC